MNARAGSLTLSRAIYWRGLVSMQQYDVYNVVVFFTGFVYDVCICYSVFFNV